MNRRSGPELSLPPPGAHGGDATALAEVLNVAPEAILDLSASMNPFAPDVVRMVRRHAEATLRYPDPSRARRSLAAAIGVGEDEVLLTNGGAEAIALVANELGIASVVEPEFSLWRRHLASVGPVVDRAGSGRVRSNPNNPLGSLAHRDDVATVWDEAFYPLATGCWTRGDTASGAIVVGSLTKVFSCPGLRLGYVLSCDPGLLGRLALRQPMWSVNGLALAVLPELLAQAALGSWTTGIAELRDGLVAVVSSLGLRVEAASAPWILVHDVPWLRDALGRVGVLVRDCASFGLEGTVRIAVAPPAGLDRFADALERAVRQRR